LKNKFLIFLSLFINLIVITTSVVLYVSLSKKTEIIARLLEETGSSVIEQSIPIHEDIYIQSDFHITESIPVNVKMNISQILEIHDTLTVRQLVMIPFAMQIDQLIHMDTIFNISKPVSIIINDTIPMKQNITIHIGNIPFNMPVETRIPINQELLVTMNEIPVSGVIPVKFELRDTLPVELDFPFPVTMKVPINMNINERAIISFYSTMPTSGKIPLEMQVPVNLPLSETQLKEKLDSVAIILREMVGINGKD
jgi:hypothetical protein